MSRSQSPRPRIVFLNRSYWPDAEATGQLLTELCEDLASEYDITVICGQPNQNPDGVAYRRTGQQLHQGVRVHRVWNSRFSKKRLLGRCLNLLTYLIMASWAALRMPRPEVVITETDPPVLCLLGGLLRRRHSCRLVVYLQDIYPDLAVALGKLRENWLSRHLRRWFFDVYCGADSVVVLSDDMRAVLRSGGVEAAKIRKITNWTDTRQVYPVKQANAFRQSQGCGDRFIVMYSGNMGLGQRLDDILAAAQLLGDREEIQFLLVGDGANRARLQDMALRQRLKNVHFVPYQPKRELAESLSAADLHLIPLDPRIVQFLMPSKLYGILASGTAFVAIAPENCELAQLTTSERVGLVTQPLAPSALAEAIAWLADNQEETLAMGRRGRELAERSFDRKVGVAQFADLLQQLTAGITSPAGLSVPDAPSLPPVVAAEPAPSLPIGQGQFLPAGQLPE